MRSERSDEEGGDAYDFCREAGLRDDGKRIVPRPEGNKNVSEVKSDCDKANGWQSHKIRQSDRCGRAQRMGE